MNWAEVRVSTTPEGIEILTGFLMAHGVNGVMIEDAGDFNRFLNDTTIHWDYVDEELMKMAECETAVKFLPAGQSSGLRDAQSDPCRSVDAPGGSGDRFRRASGDHLLSGRRGLGDGVEEILSAHRGQRHSCRDSGVGEIRRQRRGRWCCGWIRAWPSAAEATIPPGSA